MWRHQVNGMDSGLSYLYHSIQSRTALNFQHTSEIRRIEDLHIKMENTSPQCLRWFDGVNIWNQ